MTNLKQQVLDAINTIPLEEAAQWFGVGADIIDRWKKGESSPNLAAAQRAVDWWEEHAPQLPGELPGQSLDPGRTTAPIATLDSVRPLEVQLVENTHPDAWEVDLETGRFYGMPGKKGWNVCLLLPVHREISPAVVTCWLALAKRFDIGFDIESGSLLIQARNALANRFLSLPHEWALFLDSDILIPFGNRVWYANTTASQPATNRAGGFEIVPRFLSHNQLIMGGVYAQRVRAGRLVIQPDIAPKNFDDLRLSNNIRSYQGGGLKRVDWLGAGCLMVHRTVFEKIRQRGNGSSNEPFPFFTPRGTESEDIAFSLRARECGFDLWLDTDFICGHIGKYCYMPEHTQTQQLTNV